MAIEYVGEERLRQTEGIHLKDLGCFGRLWPQFGGWSGNVRLIPEEIIDTEYKLSFVFLFPVRNRTPIKMFCFVFENKQ